MYNNETDYIWRLTAFCILVILNMYIFIKLCKWIFEAKTRAFLAKTTVQQEKSYHLN